MNLKLSFEQRLKRQGINSAGSEESTFNKTYLKQFLGCEFWIWDRDRHQEKHLKTKGKCCFNHMIGLPRKNNTPHSIYPWQREIYDGLQQHKLLAILKSRSVGASELLLRYAMWLCVKDDKLRGKNIAIITGIRENLSLELVSRFRNLLPANFEWSGKEGTAEINGCRVIGYPSMRGPKDLRGLSDLALCICDEFSWFNPTDQLQLLPVVEAFRTKSDTQIVLLSTPGPLNDVYYNLFAEPPDTCRYHRIYIPYQKALGTLFTEEEIAQARRQPGFAQEFELKFGTPYNIGSIFSWSDIERACQLGLQYSSSDQVIDIDPDAEVHAIGVDYGAGRSKFALSMVQLLNDKLILTRAEEYSKPSEDEMISKILAWRRKTGKPRTTKIMVDGSAVGFIRRLKACIPNERVDYEVYIDELRRRKLIRPPDEQQIVHYMTVIPVPFSKYGQKLLATLYALLQKGDIAIHPTKFSVLVEQLQSARNVAGTGRGGSSQFILDKTTTGQSFDCLDSLRLCMFNFDAGAPEFEIEEESEEEEEGAPVSAAVERLRHHRELTA